MSLKQPVTLVKGLRAGITESIHYGHYVVLNEKQEIITAGGNPFFFTFMRSAAKPFQILPFLEAEGDKYFRLTPAEIAIMVSSHYGEDFHLKTLKSIIRKTGLKISDLQCGKSLSLKADYSLQLAYRNQRPAALFNDCSGKHLAMLACCLLKNYPLNNYLHLEHPLQQEISQTVAEVCDFPAHKIKTGIDGCSAPVFALPLFNMEAGFLKLSLPETLPARRFAALKTVSAAIAAHPRMIAGSGGFCSKLCRATKKRVIGKIGAEGIYCAVVRDKKFALAVKLESGRLDLLAIPVIQILKDLQLINEEEFAALKNFYHQQRLNDRKTVVGEYVSAFSLNP